MPPTFVKRLTPSSLRLNEGENLHLEGIIQPTTDENLEVVWFKGEAPLPAGA